MLSAGVNRIWVPVFVIEILAFGFDDFVYVLSHVVIFGDHVFFARVLVYHITGLGYVVGIIDISGYIHITGWVYITGLINGSGWIYASGLIDMTGLINVTATVSLVGQSFAGIDCGIRVRRRWSIVWSM